MGKRGGVMDKMDDTLRLLHTLNIPIRRAYALRLRLHV